MAARVISRASTASIELFDAMPSVGRKFLMAGKGRHEHHALGTIRRLPRPLRRSPRGACADARRSAPEALREWMRTWASRVLSAARAGSSRGMKAAPLVARGCTGLREQAVRFHVRHRLTGLERLADDHYRLRFATPDGERQIEAHRVVLALGGGSWARLGSDGHWIGLPEQAAYRSRRCVRPTAASIPTGARICASACRTASESVGASVIDASGTEHRRQGEFVITDTGVEGGLIYALSAHLRDAIERDGQRDAHA